jgi:hypothetical protein
MREPSYSDYFVRAVDRSMNGRALSLLLTPGVAAFVLFNEESTATPVQPNANEPVRVCLEAQAEESGTTTCAAVGLWLAAHPKQTVESILGVPFDTGMIEMVFGELGLDGERLLFERLPAYGGGHPIRIRFGDAVALVMPCPNVKVGRLPLELTPCEAVAPDLAWLRVFPEGAPTKPMRPVATVTKTGVDVTPEVLDG